MDPALWQVLANTPGGVDPEIEAVVRLRAPGAEIPGVRMVARFGHVATCRLKVSQILEVRADPVVVSLKAARSLGAERPRTPPSGDPLSGRWLRRPRGLDVTGAGVVVGVVDWGCDFAHPDFLADDGSTRLLALWDQRGGSTPSSPQPYDYGRLHRRRDIDGALATAEPYAALAYHPASADPGDGSHGTHVLGIAAGNGRAGGPCGIAPEASLVFVHLADHGTEGLANLGDSVRLLEGVDFVRRVAGPLPWVVNLSVGRHGGPHDGSTLVELALDELLRERAGQFVCQSAGNYFEARTHTSGLLVQGKPTSFTFDVDPGDETPNELEIWYAGGDAIDVRIQPPGPLPGPYVPVGGRADLEVAGSLAGRVYNRALDPNNGRNHIDAFLAPLPGRWTITLLPTRVVDGHWDAWLERDEACPHCQARFTSADPARTIGTIANGHLPLVVGAYDPRPGWPPPAHFSSAGPTRDGRPKPDLAAPGTRVLAARSAPAGARDSPGLATVKSGTSMASPQVTGAVALCLEAQRFTARELRQLVLSSVRSPDVNAGAATPDRLGRGYLDLPRLVAAALAAPTGRTRYSAKAGPMTEDIEAAGVWAIAPDNAYRELLYRPDGAIARWLARDFDVVARPLQDIDRGARAGDLLVEITLGRRRSGACRRVVSVGDGSGRGPDAAGALLLAELAERSGGLRLLDTSRGMPPGCLLIRPRAVADTDAEGTDFDAERTAVVVDATVAVPAFTATQRSTMLPLLPAPRLRTAVAWNARMHPARSGVVAAEIGAALDAYVDAAAVTAAMSRASIGTAPSAAEVLAERVHQFQQRCYLDSSEHDGSAGETTLDSLGLVVRDGPELTTADSGSADAQAHVQSRNARVKAATGNEFDATNWFSRMADPSIFGVRTKGGAGLHLVLIRKLRAAELALRALPAFANMTPAELGTALGISEKHGGTRHQSGTDVHTMGIAIDISYTADPWVHVASSWQAIQHAALLIGGVRLAQRSAPAYFDSMGSDPARSTGSVWDELHTRNEEFRAYFALQGKLADVRAQLAAGVANNVAGLVASGETLDDAAQRWSRQITADRDAVVADDFAGHVAPSHGFLTHARELVIALRDQGCLAWGAVDFGSGTAASGDMMHFDARVDGVGRVLTADTGAWLPRPGHHPCLPAPAAGAAHAGSAESAEWIDDATDAESAPDDAKKAIVAALEGFGTDLPAALAALKKLSAPDMAVLLGDASTINVIVDNLSSAEQAQLTPQLARGRVLDMSHADVGKILAAPASHRLGTIAAALGRDALLTHHEAFDRTGTGTIQGNRCPAPLPGGATASDCTEYVKDVLARAFAAAGRKAAWTAALSAAVRGSGTAGLKGTEMIRALVDGEGWEAVFWAPDPTDPADNQSEHPVAWKAVQSKGTYYGIKVDQARSVVNYRRTRTTHPTDLTGIAHLQRLQFGVLAARGGTHMALVVNGSVHEVHWMDAATVRDAIQATPLEAFAWQSGAIAAPKGDLALAWRTP